MSQYTDRYWDSADGLRLHLRDYAGGDSGDSNRPPVLCLPGLTRNGRDFAGLAERLSPRWRVLCPDMRGRGASDFAQDSATYNPMQYVADINAMLDQLGIARFVAVGTSLGGLMTMVLALIAPDRIAGAVLNDVGPVIEAEGLGRIRDYVGKARSFARWDDAAQALAAEQACAFPDYTHEDWLAMARRLMVADSDGQIVFDYDMKIAEPFAAPGGEAGVDMWPGLMALAGRPVLCLRGGLSDILSGETLAEMGRRLPDAELLTLARIGHAPSLDEPQAAAAIARLLARVAA